MCHTYDTQDRKRGPKGNKVNQTSFKATRRKVADHPIEAIGNELRAMMPWITANRLVDKDKN